MTSKTTPESVFLMTFRRRNVAILRERCLTHEDTIATVKSTFSSLKGVLDEEIVLLSALPGYHWHGLIEISTDAWEELRDSVSYVKVVLNAERELLEDNNQAGVNSN